MLPNDLKKFYQEVHNGFYFFPGKFMGLQEIKDVDVMSEYDWGVISDLDIHIDFDLDDYIIIFTTGMGGYIIVKLTMIILMLLFGLMMTNRYMMKIYGTY